MGCDHQGYHSIESSYESAAGVLVWVAYCDGCGHRVRDVACQPYRPAPALRIATGAE